jgi:four helix bundle protein
MSNIAEAMTDVARENSFNFLRLPKAPAAEVSCQLYVGADQGYLQEVDFIQLNTLAAESGKMVGGSDEISSRFRLQGNQGQDHS